MIKTTESFKREFARLSEEMFERSPENLDDRDKFAVLGRLVHYEANLRKTALTDPAAPLEGKKVYYFSMEFLIGKLMENYLINLGIRDQAAEGLKAFGTDLETLCAVETDPGLGNGGLGRLAACFIDSMAALGIKGDGMGLRYKFGLFKQKIESGYQIELPDSWLDEGYIWERPIPLDSVIVKFGGRVDRSYKDGVMEYKHVDYTCVRAVPYDVPILGFGGTTINTLHLWDAQPVHDTIDMDEFNKGNYSAAMKERSEIEAITSILYPDDRQGIGKKLRLRQEYFLVAAGVGMITREYKAKYGANEWDKLPERVQIHINDTHPTMVIPELIRQLGEHGINMTEAIDIVSKCCAYTNHTILAEALEKWPLSYLEEIVPQLVPIIEVLDNRIRRKFNDEKVAIIDSNDTVHMARLDIHYTYSTNGVASLHTEILKNSELKDFYNLYPEKFNNKTNGITYRRWLLQANPELTDYITKKIGPGFIRYSEELSDFEVYLNQEDTLNNLLTIKKVKKTQLADYLLKTRNITVDTESIFDMQTKRLHEYKRQQLNLLWVIKRYLEIKQGLIPKRKVTVFFGAKAAPAYTIAKDIIHAIIVISKIIDADPVASKYLQVVMVDNYNVTLAEKMIPACEFSEQISLASKEASGTGNMKYMLNGAVTIGTEDGANVEIHNFVGDKNIYIFGMQSDEVIKAYEKGSYNSKSYYKKDPVLKKAVDFLIGKEAMSLGNKENLKRLYDELLNKDWFMTFPDFNEYCKVREKAYEDYEDREAFAKKCGINIARAGFFSSDRTIKEYNNDIWHLEAN